MPLSHNDPTDNTLQKDTLLQTPPKYGLKQGIFLQSHNNQPITKHHPAPGFRLSLPGRPLPGAGKDTPPMRSYKQPQGINSRKQILPRMADSAECAPQAHRKTILPTWPCAVPASTHAPRNPILTKPPTDELPGHFSHL